MKTERSYKYCEIKVPIESDDYIIETQVDDTINVFDVRKNKGVEFLPKGIGEKFPNLSNLFASITGLTVVREFYFKDLKKAKGIDLSNNNIAIIEPGAFTDLISLEKLWLFNNKIETLDKNLFASMVNLADLHIHHNQIKFLSSTTFRIAGGKPMEVDLRVNVCINKNYRPDDYQLLEADLAAACKR